MTRSRLRADLDLEAVRCAALAVGYGMSGRPDLARLAQIASNAARATTNALAALEAAREEVATA